MTPKVLLDDLEVGEPTASGNLELIPLTRAGGEPASVDYLLASEAFDRGVLRVAEIDEHGSVPELRAESSADIAVLLLDGEELIGAKQNRILNTDVLLQPRAKKLVPVSCVEEGRWHHARPDFGVGSYSPPPIRSRKSSAVSRSLRESGTAESDQGEVWEGVAEFLECSATLSNTSAMADVFEKRSEDVESISRPLECPEDAIGVIARIDGRFAALDLFDRPGTLQQVWPRLVAGYAADAMGRRDRAKGSEGEPDGDELLNPLQAVECTVCDAVDLGQDWRFESAELTGSALVVEERALHLSAFPKEADDDMDAAPPPIASPSERRRKDR